MRILKTLLPLPLSLALSACIVVPVVDHDETGNPTCKTHTKSMSLKTVELTPNNATCRDEACLAVVLAVSAGSVLVSGSIVLTGNTVHWLEYQGSCSDGYLNVSKQLFLETFSKPSSTPAI